MMGQNPQHQERLDIGDLQRLYDTFEGESDRGAAIVGAAYLEARLAELIGAFLTEDATNAHGDLKWPVDTLAKRISVAHWLGLTSENEDHDLKKISIIRNRFAHKGHELSFSAPPIAAECNRLRLWKPLSEVMPLDTARSQFLFTTTSLLMQLGIRVLRAKRERRAKPDEFKIAEIVR